jgi:hypothetical protein
MVGLTELKKAHSRGRATVFFLGVACALDVLFALHVAIHPASFVGGEDVDFECGYAVAAALLCVVLTVAFLVWVCALHRAAVAAGARPGPYILAEATVAYFLPVVSLWWPYRGLRDLDRAIDPAGLPEPPRPNPGAHPLGYRDAAISPARSPNPPRPPLEVWWAVWTARTAVGLLACTGSFRVALALLTQVMDAAAAIAAIAVVARMDARLAERSKRAASFVAPNP